MRDFYQRQDAAKDETIWLIAFLVAATTITIVAFGMIAAFTSVVLGMAYMSLITNMKLPADFFSQAFLSRAWWGTGVAAAVVIGTTLYRSWQYAQGGGRTVAKLLGGHRLLEMESNPTEKQVLNIVDELAIATGIRPPALYVLPSEPSINAFAAGIHDKDNAIGVTQGAIDQLTRAQLQGLLAHEFSHLVQRDTTLNIRLMGALAGLHTLADTASSLIRLGLKGPSSHGLAVGRNNGLARILALVVGLILYPVGKIGLFFACLIKQAVNRQREFLADATAVEITRNPSGLCETLEKIALAGSRVQSPHASLASHLFFADSQGSWNHWLDTHPPLAERIRRLGGIPPAADTEPTVAQTEPASIC